ncbi:MAG: hypothetical protein JZU53_18475 [Paludibacter sp.]|nr:hypothetical protein [Paludibacter sp.]
MFIFYIVLVGLSVAFLFLTTWLPKQNWFLESTDESFKLYLKAYYVYNKEVIKNHKLYNYFVSDFCNENIFLVTSAVANINGAVNDLNKKNRIYNRVRNLLETRPDLVQKYFQENTFTYDNYKLLNNEYDTTYPIQISLESPHKEDDIRLNSFEDVSEIIKEEILNYENEIKTPKHIGHRIFGYVLKEGYINASKNDEQRLDAWREFTGLENNIPEYHYLRNPRDNKNSSKKINPQLKVIDEFFHSIKLPVDVYYDEKR